jgi:hypothetical protein
VRSNARRQKDHDAMRRIAHHAPGVYSKNVSVRAGRITVALAQILQTSCNPWQSVEALLRDEIDDAARLRATEICCLQGNE